MEKSIKQFERCRFYWEITLFWSPVWDKKWFCWLKTTSCHTIHTEQYKRCTVYATIIHEHCTVHTLLLYTLYWNKWVKCTHYTTIIHNVHHLVCTLLQYTLCTVYTTIKHTLQYLVCTLQQYKLHSTNCVQCTLPLYTQYSY